MATLAATAPQKVFACLLFFFFGPCRFARLPITENWWFVVDTGREDEESERSASPVSRASCVLSFSGRMKNAGGQSCWVWGGSSLATSLPPSLPPPITINRRVIWSRQRQVSIHVTTTFIAFAHTDSANSKYESMNEFFFRPHISTHPKELFLALPID
jgi:hypothetical protein